MKLLVVTDHRFLSAADGSIHDTYCFDRTFFDDYRRVFSEVRVAARVRDEPIPERASRSDGDGVSFVRLDDVQGGRWAASLPRRYRQALPAAVTWADAVCVRIPAIAGSHAAHWANKAGKPLMFELIGDPLSAVQGPEHGLATRSFGLLLAAATRWITRRATVGSYVSRHHLQRRYPVRPGIPTESISSIRLSADDIRPARRWSRAPAPLRLVLTASLVPVKAHCMLLDAVAHACRLGVDTTLALCGDGPLRAPLQRQAQSLGIEQRVTFHGHVVSRSRLHRILDESDLFVMTSVSEGMPRAMLEAMARGLPCIGTRAGGIGELLDHSMSVRVGDSRGLGALIHELSRAPHRLSAMAEYSHAVVQEYVDAVLSARRQRLLHALHDAARR